MSLCDNCETVAHCSTRGCVFAVPEKLLRREPKKAPPTFDEWHQATFGQSFEQRWMGNGQRMDHAMRALTIALRDYTTAMVAETLSPCAGGR